MSTIDAGTRPTSITPEAAAMLEDVQFLVENGTHPLLVAQMLGRSMGSIEKAARLHGMPELAVLFGRTYNNWEEQP